MREIESIIQQVEDDIRLNSPGNADTVLAILRDLVDWSMQGPLPLEHDPPTKGKTRAIRFRDPIGQRIVWIGRPSGSEGPKIELTGYRGESFSASDATKIFAGVNSIRSGGPLAQNQIPIVPMSDLNNANAMERMKDLLRWLSRRLAVGGSIEART